MLVASFVLSKLCVIMALVSVSTQRVWHTFSSCARVNEVWATPNILLAPPAHAIAEANNNNFPIMTCRFKRYVWTCASLAPRDYNLSVGTPKLWNQLCMASVFSQRIARLFLLLHTASWCIQPVGKRKKTQPQLLAILAVATNHTASVRQCPPWPTIVSRSQTLAGR